MDELEEADAVISALEKEIKLNKRTFSDFAVLYRINAQSELWKIVLGVWEFRIILLVEFDSMSVKK